MKRDGYIKQAWLVLLLALGFGAALAGVHLGLKDKIAANLRDKTLNQIPKLIQDNGRTADKSLTEKFQYGPEGSGTVYKAFAGSGGDADHIGWLIRTKGQGFADQIELVVALDADAEKILGVSVLSQKETPGLGDKIQSDDSFAGQFAGTDAKADLEVVKASPDAENEIQAITGATVSSKAVTDIVNRAVIEFRNALLQGQVSPATQEQEKQ
ncbi:MAG: FMN-binding protein [Phycisphaerae bacterium]